MCLRVEKIRLFYLVLYTVWFGWFSWSAIAETNQKHAFDTIGPYSHYTKSTDIQACNAATRKTKDGLQWVSQSIAANANASWVKLNSEYWYNWELEAKRRGLTCGVVGTSSTKTASPSTTQPNTLSSAELLAAQKEAERLRQELAALKAEQEQQQQTISGDTKLPTITIASTTTNGAQGIIVDSK